MIDKFMDLFKEKEASKEEVKKEDKTHPNMEAIKKKILEAINKIEPKKELELESLSFKTEQLPDTSSEEHQEKLKDFLETPSIDDLKKLKKNGEWKHLNKIFVKSYGQE